MLFVKDLKGKSDNQKKRILVIVLIVLMPLVFFAWFLQIKNYSPVESNLELTPIIDLKNEVTGAYTESMEKIKSIKEDMGNPDEINPNL
ncbi:MAG: hypothetical protein U9P50_00555 [Patescibacteria group bacterium]|nr:hypothetical protein [Patescibacteria group bacterium]